MHATTGTTGAAGRGGTRRGRGRAAQATEWLARGAVAGLGAVVGLRLGWGPRFTLGPFQVRGRMSAGRGGTVVDVPPLGQARLSTHAGPLQLQATLLSVDPQAVSDLLSAGSARPSDLLGHVTGRGLRVAGVRVVARGAAAAIGGAATASALVFGRSRDAAIGTAVSAALVAAAGVRAATTWRSDAWRDPTLSGVLAHAPRVLGDLRRLPERIQAYRDQLRELLETAGRLHSRLTSLPEAPDSDAIRLLHVSDLHLNPAGLDLIEALAGEYRVAAVVDTGDLVEWGSAPEQRLVERIGRLGVPYVYIRGNHDSDGTERYVRERPNAVVLGGGAPVEVAGVRFVGIGDPRFTPDKRTGDDRPDPERLASAGQALADAVRAAGSPADVALVHDPASAGPLAGVVPLVLAGHTHRRRRIRLGDDSLLLVQGSTGGAGLRGVQSDPPAPMTATVLHLSTSTRRLEAVDEITVGGPGTTRIEIARHRAADLPVDNESGKSA